VKDMTAPTLQPYRGSYLMPPADEATVADVMHPGVLTCAPETSLRDVAEIMATHRTHAVVVDGIATDAVRGSHLVWGVVSALDLARAIDEDPDRVDAGRIAVTEIVTVAPSDSLSQAARLMSEHDVMHLVVVPERRGRPVGVISAFDIARAVAWGGRMPATGAGRAG
jgi:CBS domain-containing protein